MMADRRAHIDLLEAYRLTGDRAARDRLVEELMPLVRSLARRYAGRGEPVDDLVQVGAIGLIKAIDRFELERGVELSTYAVPTIVGEIRRHFRDRSWSVHVPRRMKELSLRVSRLVDELSSELGRTPTVAELADGRRRRGGRRDRGPRDGARAHAGVPLDPGRRDRRADADRPARRGGGGLRGARAGIGRHAPGSRGSTSGSGGSSSSASSRA